MLAGLVLAGGQAHYFFVRFPLWLAVRYFGGMLAYGSRGTIGSWVFKRCSQRIPVSRRTRFMAREHNIIIIIRSLDEFVIKEKESRNLEISRRGPHTDQFLCNHKKEHANDMSPMSITRLPNGNRSSKSAFIGTKTSAVLDFQWLKHANRIFLINARFTSTTATLTVFQTIHGSVATPTSGMPFLNLNWTSTVFCLARFTINRPTIHCTKMHNSLFSSEEGAHREYREHICCNSD